MTDSSRDHFIAKKLDAGISLSDVQKALKAELDIDLTYLELRLIAADLDVDWKKSDPKPKVEEKKVVDADPTEEIAGCQISVSKLVRPGMSISGDVIFSSGCKAEWYVDTMGGLGFNPTDETKQPTQEDLQEFQASLQAKISSGSI